MVDSSPQPPRWVSARSILTGLLLMPLLVAFNYYVEVVFYTFATYAAPFFNVVFVLFVISAANLLVRRFSPRLALSAGELIVIYAMLSLQGALASHNMMEILITVLAHPWQYATPENKWADLFIDRLPQWAMLPHPRVFEDYYLGNSTFWVPEHLIGWLRPAAVWSTFTFVLLTTMLCLSIILRRRWIEHERLSYPLVQLPLALAHRPAELLSSRVMWAGFAVVMTVQFIAGMHHLFPALPAMPVGRHSLRDVFATPPWRVLSGERWAIYPWAIGIGFLIPLDLLVSSWLFFFLYGAERVMGQALGLSRSGGFPWPDDQAFGAYMAILFMGLWVGRHYFAGVLAEGLAIWRSQRDSEDPAHRWAVWGALLGSLYLVWFGTRVGLSWPMAIAFFFVYFALATTITRIRAEMGFPTHDMHNMSPPHTFTRLFRPVSFGPGNLVGMSVLYWFNRVYASHPMPHQLEAFKMAQEAKASERLVTIGMVVAAFFGPWFVFLVLPHFYYQLGSETANVNQWGTQFGHQNFGMLASWLQQQQPFDPSHLMATGAGFGVAMFLGLMRMRIVGWPLHPLAYAIANSWGMQQLWLSLLIASLIKWGMLRGGGLATYRRWIPFFLGMALGDFTAGTLWNLAGIFGGFYPYDFWPGQLP